MSSILAKQLNCVLLKFHFLKENYFAEEVVMEFVIAVCNRFFTTSFKENKPKTYTTNKMFFGKLALVANVLFHLLLVQWNDLLWNSVKLYTFPMFFLVIIASLGRVCSTKPFKVKKISKRITPLYWKDMCFYMTHL